MPIYNITAQKVTIREVDFPVEANSKGQARHFLFQDTELVESVTERGNIKEIHHSVTGIDELTDEELEHFYGDDCKPYKFKQQLTEE